METDELKFYNFEDYTKFLGFYYFLREEFPFSVKDYENIKCNWGSDTMFDLIHDGLIEKE